MLGKVEIFETMVCGRTQCRSVYKIIYLIKIQSILFYSEGEREIVTEKL